jgi:Mg-chelatase subunit ChlD
MSNEQTKTINENLIMASAIIDRSGSMDDMGGAKEMAGTINRFFQDQYKLDGKEVISSITTFDDEIENVIPPTREHITVNADDIEPRGLTAMTEAIGKTIETTGNYLRDLDDRPGLVIIFILTDGEENASTGTWSGRSGVNKLKELIKRQTTVYSWQFVFAGANIDAVDVGGSIGIESARCINFSPNTRGHSRAMKACSDMTTELARMNVEERGNYKGFSDNVRYECMEAN